jgi:hypothetical protein
MLKVSRKRGSIKVETMGGIVAWDSQGGGQISGLTVKDELFAHDLLPAGGLLPDLQFTINGSRVRLAQAPAELKVTQKAADFVKIQATAALADGALLVTQEYEVHEEGVLFCNLAIDTPAGKRFDLRECALHVALDTRSAKVARWGHYLRQPKYKRDYSTVHAFTTPVMFLTATDRAEGRELFPFVALDLGWEATRFFSNHLEFILEDWTSYNDGPLTQTCTRVWQEDGLWQVRWNFHEGNTVPINGSYRYRNRWGLMFGRARTQSGPKADPAVRNNALGCRLCHCMYPYARTGDYWPWVSMPIKQVPAQPPQFFKGNPELKRADEALQLGANLMILHQFWMRNPGSNNEPVADYQPYDAKWLKAFTARCHRLGMPVLYYARGTEMWQHFSPFFEDFLNRNQDGLYVDWNTPFCMGYVKCSDLHVSLHNYFHFTKAQRRRVGPGGVLIGHTGNANMIGSACFDVAVGGEFSVRHDQLLTNPESSAYYAQVNCMGAHLISGNLPDRLEFSSPKAAAICAALGMTSHPFMEPGVAFRDRTAYIQPLWNAMNSLPGRVVRLHNPAYSPTRAVRTGAAHLFPSLWQSDKNKALLLVTNMAPDAQSGDVELELKELKVPAKAAIRPLPIAGTFQAAQVDGRTVRLKNIPALQYAALLIG